ncbi:MAG: hypothetical protein AB7N76_16175 [Planctomycetota bacterium]
MTRTPLRAALTLLFLCSAAVAQERVTGRVETDDQGGAWIRTQRHTAYAVQGDQLRNLQSLIGREVTVEGEVAGRTTTEPRGTRLTPLDVYSILSPRPALLEGVVRVRSGAPVFVVGEEALRLSGAPGSLVKQLADRKVKLGGWRFDGELAMTSAEARVAKSGYLSQKRRREDGKGWEYRTVLNVEPGEAVRVGALAGYNSKTKEWKTVEAMVDGDLLFAEVEAGRSRPGDTPFVGWIPIYKLNVGEAVEPEQVEAAQQQQAAAATTPDQQAAAATTPEQQAAAAPTPEQQAAAAVSPTQQQASEPVVPQQGASQVLEQGQAPAAKKPGAFARLRDGFKSAWRSLTDKLAKLRKSAKSEPAAQPAQQTAGEQQQQQRVSLPLGE